MEDLKLFDFTESNAEIKKNFIRAGKVHQKVYPQVRSQLYEGMKLIDICQLVESIIKKETQFTDSQEERLQRGIGFPIGLSLNECAAHWTPNPLDTQQALGKNDLIKIDYGVHFKGCIVDGAYSFSFNPELKPLIQVAEEATQLAIKNSGPDAILGEIGGVVQEFIESQEIMIRDTLVALKSFKDLTGHKIIPWMIHADKCVPNFKIDYPVRMEEGEFYAIETFPSTGKGKGIPQVECSHYQVNTELLLQEYQEINNINGNTEGKILNPIKLDRKENYVYHRILDLYQTLPFCKRWLKEEKVNKYQMPLFNLVKKKRITAFPPVSDIPNSYVAQSEKTILITSGGTKILN